MKKKRIDPQFFLSGATTIPSPRMFTIIRRGRIRGLPLKYKRVERRDGAWIVGRLHSSLPSPIVRIALFLHCEPCFYLTVASRRKEERAAIKEPLSLRGGGEGGETMERAGGRRGLSRRMEREERVGRKVWREKNLLLLLGCWTVARIDTVRRRWLSRIGFGFFFSFFSKDSLKLDGISRGRRKGDGKIDIIRIIKIVFDSFDSVREVRRNLCRRWSK